MKTSDHVTRNQIDAFGAGALAATDLRAVGGHLIRCVECRSLLPLPNAAQVWTAVTSERDFGEASSVPAEPSYGEPFAGIFGGPNRLAWAGGMFAVVVSLAILLIFSISNEQKVENEVVRSFELEGPISKPNGNPPNSVNAVVPGATQGDSSDEEPNSTRGDKGSRDALRKPAGSVTPTASKTANKRKITISATRGTIAPCTIGKRIEVELGSTKTDLVLRWKPVPKAAKYHLYVSDDSEMLIDEFETDDETSYVLKKQLDPTKSYKWKIVITLESGQKLYVDAQKFTANDFQSSLGGYKRMTRSNTRCLANE